jgi:hypothetical protein
VLQLGEEPLDEVALAVEPLAEARLPAPVALRRDIGRRALILDQLADAIGVVGLVGQHDGSRAEMIEEAIGDLAAVRLPSGQAEPDREALGIDDDVDFGRKPASGASETMIWTPFCRRGLLMRPDGSAVDHLDFAVVRCADGVHQPVPHARLP